MKISFHQAIKIGDRIGVDWSRTSTTEFWKGVNEEMEHTLIIGEDLRLTGIIAMDHLEEVPDYYTRLEKAMR